MFCQGKRVLAMVDGGAWNSAFPLIVMLVFCLAIAACDSGVAKEAKEAYDSGDYSRVVSLLEDERDLDEEASEMLSVSKAHAAFDARDYLGAITELAEVKNGNEEIYDDAVSGLVEKALESSSEGDLLKAIEVDPSIGEAAAGAIKERCETLDYGAFEFMDRMLKKMPESEGKAQLQTYRDKSELLRPKAFLLGKWEWQSDGDVKTRVSCVQRKDNLIATVDVVGDVERDYKIMKDDVYWKDFDFNEPDRFTCMCLCKTGDGIGVECTTVGTIDYEGDALHLHLTAPDPYWMDEESSDRDWKRISE